MWLNGGSGMRALIAILGTLAAFPACAHDQWANGAPIPSWVKDSCCGPADAHHLTSDQVHRYGDYYRVDGFRRPIPIALALPSQDGDYWIFFGTKMERRASTAAGATGNRASIVSLCRWRFEPEVLERLKPSAWIVRVGRLFFGGFASAVRMAGRTARSILDGTRVRKQSRSVVLPFSVLSANGRPGPPRVTILRQRTFPSFRKALHDSSPSIGFNRSFSCRRPFVHRGRCFERLARHRR